MQYQRDEQYPSIPTSSGKELSALPLEIKLEGEPPPPPLYGQTLDDAGIRNAKVALPFNAYGTLVGLGAMKPPTGATDQSLVPPHTRGSVSLSRSLYISL